VVAATALVALALLFPLRAFFSSASGDSALALLETDYVTVMLGGTPVFLLWEVVLAFYVGLRSMHMVVVANVTVAALTGLFDWLFAASGLLGPLPVCTAPVRVVVTSRSLCAFATPQKWGVVGVALASLLATFGGVIILGVPMFARRQWRTQYRIGTPTFSWALFCVLLKVVRATPSLLLPPSLPPSHPSSSLFLCS